MYQYHAKTFMTLERVQTLRSDPYPESIDSMHYILVLPVFRFTTNFYVPPIKSFLTSIIMCNINWIKSTSKSIQPALLKMCSPVIYHVRFLSLNCLIKDMIIPNTLLNLSPLLPSGLSKNKRLSLSPSFWTCQWSVKILSAQIKHFLIWSCFIPYKEARKTTSS